MGACGGQKEKPEAAADEAPVAAAKGKPDMAKDKAEKERMDKSLSWLSSDLRTLMQDYFNRCEIPPCWLPTQVPHVAIFCQMIWMVRKQSTRARS